MGELHKSAWHCIRFEIEIGHRREHGVTIKIEINSHASKFRQLYTASNKRSLVFHITGSIKISTIILPYNNNS